LRLQRRRLRLDQRRTRRVGGWGLHLRLNNYRFGLRLDCRRLCQWLARHRLRLRLRQRRLRLGDKRLRRDDCRLRLGGSGLRLRHARL
jgi:hypothetical protein